MIDQITDALPAPVAPTIRMWLPTSGSRHTVPSSTNATGMPAVQAVRVGRERRHEVFERVADQQPQLQQVPPAGHGADPAVGRPEGLREPVRHRGVVVDGLPGAASSP